MLVIIEDFNQFMQQSRCRVVIVNKNCDYQSICASKELYRGCEGVTCS